MFKHEFATDIESKCVQPSTYDLGHRCAIFNDERSRKWSISHQVSAALNLLLTTTRCKPKSSTCASLASNHASGHANMSGTHARQHDARHDYAHTSTEAGVGLTNRQAMVSNLVRVRLKKIVFN